MNKTQPSKRLSRRDFVKLTALAGLATMGGYVLSEYSPWLDFEGEVEHMLRPFEQDATLPAQMRELFVMPRLRQTDTTPSPGCS